MTNDRIWKTRNQCNNEAIEYNPLIAENLKNDQDYCIRGMVYDKDTNLYCEFDIWLITKG